MVTTVPFIKVHGLGNDFALFDGLNASIPLKTLIDPHVARLLCDRHRGIGGDGLLLMLPPRTPTADATMRIINADGSEAEMCGNGIRCLARVLHDRTPALRDRSLLAIDTGAGLLTCALVCGADGGVEAVCVDMGPARFKDPSLPSVRGEPFVDHKITLTGRVWSGTAVSMGNPHLVFFLDEGEDPHQLALESGPRFENHPLFPNRTNVEFAATQPDGLELWVWERGCGLTQACGTGACATGAAAVATGRHPHDVPLRIHLPGGMLTITVPERDAGVQMEGPAVEAFAGSITL